MRKILVFAAFLMTLCSCDKDGIVIKGTLDNASNEYIYLQELTVDDKGLTDSVSLGKSGSFKFKRKITYPVFYSMWVGKNHKYVTLLAHPGDRIKITGKADKFFQSYQVTGSDDSKKVQLVTQRLSKTIQGIDSLNNVYHQFAGNPNIVNIYKVLSLNCSNLIADQRKFTISFIEQNPSSLASILALYQKIDSVNWILGEEGDLKYYLKVDSSLYSKYRNTPHVASLHANVIKMKEQQQALNMQRLLSIMGAKSPEIAMPTLKGDTLKLSSFKGKVVLLYFWASWNDDSRKLNKELITLYNNFKPKGFEIYQVSLDKSKDDWVKAIKEDGLWWPQVSDLKYWQSPVVNLFNFSKLPTSYIIDRNGFIISRDLSGEELTKKIASSLEEKSTTASK